MPIPTITNVTPALGHSGGGTIVKIEGTNFAVQTPTPGPLIASARVFFGGVEARLVRVVSGTTIYAQTERHDPGAVDVEVRNVGSFGETIGAETVTSADAFTYARPVFTAGQNPFDLVTRALHAELARQVYPEVVITAHVDWTDDPASLLRKVASSKIPTVFLAGPSSRENTFFRTSARRVETLEPGLFIEHRSARHVDLVYVFGALADKFSTLTSLANALEDFTTRNPKLHVPIAGGSSTRVAFELMREGTLEIDSTPEESNVRTVTGTIFIQGVPILGNPGFENDHARDVYPTLSTAPELQETERPE